MILTCHLLAGAAVASKISNPFMALPLALLSHYLLDSLPQEEYSVRNIRERRWSKMLPDAIKVMSDIALGFLLILFFSNDSPLVFTAALLAIAPDTITLLNDYLPGNKLFTKHQKIHQALNGIFYSQKIKMPFYSGILSQIAVSLIAISFL